MIKEAWGFIIHSPLKIALVICIVLPAIFAGLFLGSLFDPFGESSNLKAAVINHDKTVEFNDKDIHIGKTMVEELKDVDDMTFVETDESEAEEGLRSGKYAMVVTIPENFSKNAASLLDEDPQKMKLEIETNPATNYLVSNIADNASKEIKAKVTKQVNKKYAEAMFDAMDDMEDGLKTAKEKSEKLSDGVDKLKDGQSNLSEGYENLAEGHQSLSDGVSSLNSGIGKLSTGVGKLDTGTVSLYEGTQKLKSGSDNLKNGVSSLSEGIGNLESHLPSSDSIKSLQGGLEGMKSAMSAKSEDGTVVLSPAQAAQYEKLISGASQALDGYDSVRSATDKLQSGANKLESGVSTLEKNTKKLESGANSLKSGVSTLKKNTEKLKDGGEKLKTGVDNLGDGVDNLGDGVDSLGDGVGNMSSGVEKLQTKLSDGIDTADENLGNVSKATYNQAGTPVKLSTDEVVSVDNLGTSLAAFFLSIGAWMCAMVFCMMYPISGRKPERGIRSWAENAVVFVPVAIVGGLALLPLMNLFLNISPVDYPATLGVTALAALAFMSIIYFLNIAVGKPAMAVVLALLALQLACAGGIFPTVMQSDFYQALSPWLPMTYSVEALRSTIAAGGDILVPILVLVGVAVLFNVLSIIVHIVKGKKASKQVDVSARLAAMGVS